MHAGGVVIAPSVLTDFAPLYRDASGGNVVTQFDKDDVEAAGLVKFDFLGLRTLTIIERAAALINCARPPQSPPLTVSALPMDDAPTYALLKSCRTTAVFQLESRGMKDLIRRLQPDCFEDIVALVALFRPGPLQSGMVDDFINRKHGRSDGPIDYLHPSLEPILKPTYGVILYQEQVMQIAQVLAGYTLGGADLLRRAMGKKSPAEMAQQRSVFVSGAVARAVRGVGQGAAEALIAERSARGVYSGLEDLCRRLDLQKVNRRVLEALLRAGSLDGLGANRATLMDRLSAAMHLGDQNSRAHAAGQNDRFGLASEERASAAPARGGPVLPEWSEAVRLAGERETRGLYLTGHPLARFDEFSDAWRLSARRISELDKVLEQEARRLVIRCTHTDAPALCERLATILAPWRPGPCPVTIEYTGRETCGALTLGGEWTVRASRELLEQLEGLLGRGALQVVYGAPAASPGPSFSADGR